MSSVPATTAIAHSTFLGLTAEGHVALWTAVLAVATSALVIMGLRQLRSIRDEANRERTLRVCERYDTDPILDRALRRLAIGWRTGDIQRDPEKYRPFVTTVLNYLDTLAIGIAQGLYIEELARDHLAEIVKFHHREYLGRDAVEFRNSTKTFTVSSRN
jgi:hypothetical protein